MRRIRTSKPGVIWLQGPGPCDLWTYADEGDEIQAQELTFFGRAVVLRGEHLLTGLSREGAAAGHTGSTGILDFDRTPDPETLEGAERVLDGLPAAVQTEATADFRHRIREARDRAAARSA